MGAVALHGGPYRALLARQAMQPPTTPTLARPHRCSRGGPSPPKAFRRTGGHRTRALQAMQGHRSGSWGLLRMGAPTPTQSLPNSPCKATASNSLHGWLLKSVPVSFEPVQRNASGGLGPPPRAPVRPKPHGLLLDNPGAPLLKGTNRTS